MTGRTGRRTPLTAEQAHGLAGAYADLVFGTLAPEFTEDVAAAFLREQERKKVATAEPVGTPPLTPDGSSSNTVEEGMQTYRAAKARIATACAATELVDDVRNFPRCPHHLDDARCTRREHEGDHEIAEGDLVVVWPGAPAEPAADEAVCGESIRLRGVAHTCERTQGHLGPHFAPTENSGDEETRLAEVLQNPPASEPAKAEWPSLDAVPADVRKVRDNGDDQYRRRKNGGWKFRPQGARHWTKLHLPAATDIYAPFVAVAEGKA